MISSFTKPTSLARNASTNQPKTLITDEQGNSSFLVYQSGIRTLLLFLTSVMMHKEQRAIMKSFRNYTFLILLLSLLSFNVQAQSSGAIAYPQGIEHVVVIGVDGMSPDGLRKAKTPVMDKMIANGAVKWNVRTVLPSSSSSNWASMIMGTGTEVHGILDNGWERDNFSLPPVVSGNTGLFPTIFSVIRKARPKAEIGAVYQWGGFGRLMEKEALSYDRNFQTEDSTANGFVEYLISKKPLFAFLHLDDVDGAGHHHGHGTAAYYASIAKVDSLIGKILNGIKDAGIAPTTLVIVTSDHGGIGYGHGGPSIEEAEIPTLYYGKGVKKGYEIKQQVYTYDLAASIAFALKITPPYAWTGRPVKSAFTGFSEPDNLWMGRKLIPSPIIFPAKNLFAQAGGLYIDQQAQVKISAVDIHTEIRYTLDGSPPSKNSTLYKAPFSLDKTTVVMARTFDKDANASLTTTAYFRLVKKGAGNGLKATFYKGKDWINLPVFEDLKPSETWMSYEFNIDREQILSMLDENNSTFALSMEGYLTIDTPGEYSFYTQSDDGSQLLINNQKVVDNNGSHGVVEKSGTIKLEKGKHTIKALYFNEQGGFWLDAYYKGPGVPKQIIPADKLFLNKN